MDTEDIATAVMNAAAWAGVFFGIAFGLDSWWLAIAATSATWSLTPPR